MVVMDEPNIFKSYKVYSDEIHVSSAINVLFFSCNNNLNCHLFYWQKMLKYIGYPYHSCAERNTALTLPLTLKSMYFTRVVCHMRNAKLPPNQHFYFQYFLLHVCYFNELLKFQYTHNVICRGEQWQTYN